MATPLVKTSVERPVKIKIKDHSTSHDHHAVDKHLVSADPIMNPPSGVAASLSTLGPPGFSRVIPRRTVKRDSSAVIIDGPLKKPRTKRYRPKYKEKLHDTDSNEIVLAPTLNDVDLNILPPSHDPGANKATMTDHEGCFRVEDVTRGVKVEEDSGCDITAEPITITQPTDPVAKSFTPPSPRSSCLTESGLEGFLDLSNSWLHHTADARSSFGVVDRPQVDSYLSLFNVVSRLMLDVAVKEESDALKKKVHELEQKISQVTSQLREKEIELKERAAEKEALIQEASERSKKDLQKIESLQAQAQEAMAAVQSERLTVADLWAELTKERVARVKAESEFLKASASCNSAEDALKRAENNFSSWREESTRIFKDVVILKKSERNMIR